MSSLGCLPCAIFDSENHHFTLPQAWKAVAIGRNQKTVKEYLEKNYTEETSTDSVKLACRALLEVVEAGGKNIEVAILRTGKQLEFLSDEDVDTVVNALEAEKAEAEKLKKKPE